MRFEPDWWIELERGYHATMAARLALLAQHGERVLFDQPQTPALALATRELMEMAVQFLCARFPRHFRLSPSSPDHWVLHNRLLGTTTDLRATPPLRVLFENVPEDFAIMLRDESSGAYSLRAAAVCSSVGWHVGMHRDRALQDIHGGVPDIPGRLAGAMDRWFARVPTDAPASRCSWTLEDRDVLFAPVPEDRSALAPAEITAADVRLRCDAQTVRRLPLSGAVVLGFRAVATPLAELRDEPFVPALLRKVLVAGDARLVGYKCLDHVRRVAVEACAAWAAEQVAAGVVPADWDVGTLDESPFFPGWKEKWQQQQNF